LAPLKTRSIGEKVICWEAEREAERGFWILCQSYVELGTSVEEPQNEEQIPEYTQKIRTRPALMVELTYRINIGTL
jgi:hypothetical protein